MDEKVTMNVKYRSGKKRRWNVLPSEAAMYIADQFDSGSMSEIARISYRAKDGSLLVYEWPFTDN